jgi:hypothetical protein
MRLSAMQIRSRNTNEGMVGEEKAMSNLNLDNDNVQEEILTVAEIRADDEDLQEKIYGWLDNVQGKVFTGEHKTAYLVIEITP